MPINIAKESNHEYNIEIQDKLQITHKELKRITNTLKEKSTNTLKGKELQIYEYKREANMHIN